MDGKTFEHLKKVISASYSTEQKHYYDNGKPKGHIFRSLKALNTWVTENELNEETRRYVNHKGIRCLNPKCSCKDLHGDSVEIDGGEATQEVTCPECNKSWIDVYTLSDVRRCD